MTHRNYYGQPYPQGTFDDPKTRVEVEDDPVCHVCGDPNAKNDVISPHSFIDEDIVVYYCEEHYNELMNENQ